MTRCVPLEPAAEAVCNQSAVPPMIFQMPPEQGRKVLEEAQDTPVYKYPARIYFILYPWRRLGVRQFSHARKASQGTCVNGVGETSELKGDFGRYPCLNGFRQNKLLSQNGHACCGNLRDTLFFTDIFFQIGF